MESPAASLGKPCYHTDFLLPAAQVSMLGFESPTVFVHPQPGTIFHSFLLQRSLCNNICGVLEKLLGRAGLGLYTEQDERQALCVTCLAEEQNNWGVIRLLQPEVILLR